MNVDDINEEIFNSSIFFDQPTEIQLQVDEESEEDHNNINVEKKLKTIINHDAIL